MFGNRRLVPNQLDGGVHPKNRRTKRDDKNNKRMLRRSRTRKGENTTGNYTTTGGKGE